MSETREPTAPDPAAPDGKVDPDYPIHIVPAHARRSLWSLGIVLFGFTFFTPTMLAGAGIAPSFTFGEFVLVAVVGSLVLGTYVSVLGAIGARTGLTTVAMARFVFGSRGAKLVSILLGGTQIGWFGVTVATFALLVQQVTTLDGTGWLWTLVLLGGFVMGITAYYGYKGMELLSIVSVPLMVVIAGWVSWRSLSEIGDQGGLGAITGSGEMSVAVAITVIVGTFVSGGTQAPNITRFARTPRQGFVSAVIAFFVGELLMIFFGGIGALAFGLGDFVEVLIALNLVGWGLVLLVANLWTTNDTTAYNFGVAGAELFDAPTKKPFVIYGVIIGTLLALPIYENLIGWLEWLGILIPAVGGVIIGDVLANWRGGMPEPTRYVPPAVRWESIAVYAVATLIAWLTSRADILIAPINGIVVAVVGQYVVNRWLQPDLGTMRRRPTPA